MSERAAFRNPNVAWPTVLVALGALGLHLLAFIAARMGALPLWAAAILGGIAAYLSFTPMHDAAHGALSKNRSFNLWLGRLCSMPLFAPFAAFRYVHLEHHKHTNDAKRDPDLYSGQGPILLLPLRWMTQDLHYYFLVARRYKQRPLRERREILIQLLVLIAIVTTLYRLGFATELFFVWFLPARIAIGLLAFAFDYLPHVPHQTSSAENRYQSTRIIDIPALTPLLLYQNYHLIHHLYPGVPFYRYRSIFLAKQKQLVQRGARIDFSDH